MLLFNYVTVWEDLIFLILFNNLSKLESAILELFNKFSQYFGCDFLSSF